MGPKSPPGDDRDDYDVSRDRAIGDDIRADPEPTLNYTVVAMVGLLAGMIVGSIFSQSGTRPHVHPGAYPPVPHPRSLAPP